MKNNQLLKTFFLTSFIIFFSFNGKGQTQLLKKYNFEEGGYYILGIRLFSDENGLADSLKEFYTDDIKVLNEIKKKWVFKKPSPMFACGYHYNILVCKNGITKESISINLNCNEIVSDLGYFYFDSELLRMFQNRFKKPTIKQEKFKSVNEARNYRSSIIEDSNLIYTQTPNWVDFEGYFTCWYECPKDITDCLFQEKSLLPKVKEEIKKNYPNENFEVIGNGGSNSDLFLEIKCNKTLEEKFTLYRRNKGYEKWTPYDLTLRTYWIKN